MPDVNVRDFGALGDGSTDDSSAFSAALTAAAAGSPGEVFVPPGTYVVQLDHAAEAPISLRGVDPQLSVIRRGNNPSSASALYLDGQGHRVRVRDLGFDGNVAVTPATGRAVLDVVYSEAPVFENLWVFDVPPGAQTFGLRAIGCDQPSVRYCDVDTDASGIVVQTYVGAESIRDVDLVGNRVMRPGQSDNRGILVATSGPGHRIDGVTVTRNRVEHPRAELDGICIELWGGAGSITDASVSENRTSGGTMGISLDHCTDSTVSHNKVRDPWWIGMEAAASSGCSYSDNRVVGGVDAVQMSAKATGPDCYDIQVEGNRFFGFTGNGIQAFTAGCLQVDGNIMRADPDGDGHVLWLRYGERVIAKGNYLVGPGGWDGIVIGPEPPVGPAQPTLRATITGNDIAGCVYPVSLYGDADPIQATRALASTNTFAGCTYKTVRHVHNGGSTLVKLVETDNLT